MPDINEETITCHSPAMGKDTAKKSPVDIPAWKFHACRHAILAVLDEGETIGWDALSRSADARLTPEERGDMGAVGWHMMTVKLEMQVRGEIHRSKKNNVQVIV